MSLLPKLSEHDKAILHSIFNPSLPLGEGVYQEEILDTLDESLDEKGDEESLKFEMAAIKYAEEKKFELSLNMLQSALDKSPKRAATYNNRAQVYRLMGNNDAALEDIAKAIELSNGSNKTLCQAYCQRGILRRKDGKDDDAREDFHQAAKLGSAFAKQQLIELNPYAALCNQMLCKVMQELN